MSTLAVVLMGVSGCGKTTIGRMLAEVIKWKFVDGDTLHSPANIAKMSAGIPLNDDDRKPWLSAVHEVMVRAREENRRVVIACSALKERYRDTIAQRENDMLFVYLKGSGDLLAQRLQGRANHFMKSAMLESQLAALEEPGPNEKRRTLVVDVSNPPAEIIRIISTAIV